MNELISIIVPVYNVEQFLARCIDSIRAQTYRNIEILLIDDGSTDNSGRVCDEYAKQDGRIKVYHKPNGGVSSARNYGLDRATGKYIGFVDSDDFIAPDMYEYLIQLIKDTNAEIAACGIADYYSDDKIVSSDGSLFRVANTIETARMLLESETPMYVVNKLFLRKAFDGIRFRENKIYEDAYIILDLAKAISLSVITDQCKYFYRRRTSSLSTLPFNKKTYDIVEAHDYNYLVACDIDQSLKGPALIRRCWARFVVLDRMSLNGGTLNTAEAKEYIHFLKNNWAGIMKSKMLTKKRKLSFLLLYISPNLYATLAKKFAEGSN